MHLKEYLDDNGIVRKWFAEKVGVGNSTLVAFINGNIGLNPKYWTKVVLLTKGLVTLQDLIKTNEVYYAKLEARKKEISHSDNCQLSQGKDTQ